MLPSCSIVTSRQPFRRGDYSARHDGENYGRSPSFERYVKPACPWPRPTGGCSPEAVNAISAGDDAYARSGGGSSAPGGGGSSALGGGGGSAPGGGGGSAPGGGGSSPGGGSNPTGTMTPSGGIGSPGGGGSTPGGSCSSGAAAAGALEVHVL